jgi:hypothetical protein
MISFTADMLSSISLSQTQYGIEPILVRPTDPFPEQFQQTCLPEHAELRAHRYLQESPSPIWLDFLFKTSELSIWSFVAS